MDKTIKELAVDIKAASLPRYKFLSEFARYLTARDIAFGDARCHFVA